MFRWASGWTSGRGVAHKMRACEVVGMIASAALLMSFVVLSTVTVFTSAPRAPAVRYLAAFGIAALLVRALAFVWEYYDNKRAARARQST